ncbi:MAG TPA: hypothetical protein VNY08_22845, partial [Bradyrhizobium sp.]|nr:hypothetical protein [Bradyrhizobium sp.]
MIAAIMAAAALVFRAKTDRCFLARESADGRTVCATGSKECRGVIEGKIRVTSRSAARRPSRP